MTPVLVGQILGVSFACGLNLYATVAALGFLARIGVIHELPPALHGLQSGIVIGTALALYLVEAVVDRVHHADSLWDAVHTFIRPPAAALLALGIVWDHPLTVQVAAAALALMMALAAHGTKAGFRVSVNATRREGRTLWMSTAEDVGAVVFVFAALQYPAATLAAGAVLVVVMAVVGPRLWRAFALGFRCVAAWFRALFVAPGWRDADRLPRHLRGLLDAPPLGAAPLRATRAAVSDLPGVGACRNGWLVLTPDGPAFLFGGILGATRADLPRPRRTDLDLGLWLNTLRVHHDDGAFTIFLLRDGPPPELTMNELEATVS
jgi:hypothetical protein